MRTTLAVAILAGLVGISGMAQAAPSSNPAVVTVFELNTAWQAVNWGTAFLVDPGGVAVTNSHMVDVTRHGGHLLVLVGGEYYFASVVCASSVPARGGYGRDVAEIQLAPADPSQGISAPFLTDTATAHTGPLPSSFPTVPMGGTLRQGEAVQVIGYGKIAGTTLQPQTSFGGQVVAFNRAGDGTMVATIDSPGGRPQEGDSGSPVMGADGKVAGMWTWYDTVNAQRSYAQTLAAVSSVCR